MIQRIQTIFLLLIAGGNVGLSVLPWAVTPRAAEAGIFSDGQFSASDNISLIAALGLAGILAVVAVLLFKKRSLQIKLTTASLIFTFVGAAIAGWLFYSAGTGAQVQFGAFLILPVAIFAWLALRFIKKDEKLVRSMDRLR